MRKILFFSILTLVASNAFARDYVVTKYGVGTDSTKINTRLIQNIIDHAAKKGGGTIVVPKGVFLTGALFFKPKTSLRLLEGAVLKGSDNISDYPLIPSRMEGKKLDYYAALINAYQVRNFSITGPGTINGNGARFWSYFWAYRDSMKKINQSATNLEVHRPRLLFIWECNNVHLSNVKLCNSGFWTTHLYQCNDVTIEGCDIQSPFSPVKAPSTDGIDIDVCKRIHIRHCYISVNDDAVCIKGGKGPTAHLLPENGVVEDVLIEDCTFGESHGVLTLGSESIHARNIVLRNCSVENNTPLLRIKMRPDTYQTFENILIDNIAGKCSTLIDLKPWKQFYSLEGTNEKPFGIVRNITFSNIKVQCSVLGEMEGNPNDTVSNILFKNMEISAANSALKTNYKDIKVENVLINGAPLVIQSMIK